MYRVPLPKRNQTSPRLAVASSRCCFHATLVAYGFETVVVLRRNARWLPLSYSVRHCQLYLVPLLPVLPKGLTGCWTRAKFFFGISVVILSISGSPASRNVQFPACRRHTGCHPGNRKTSRMSITSSVQFATVLASRLAQYAEVGGKPRAVKVAQIKDVLYQYETNSNICP